MQIRGLRHVAAAAFLNNRVDATAEIQAGLLVLLLLRIQQLDSRRVHQHGTWPGLITAHVVGVVVGVRLRLRLHHDCSFTHVIPLLARVRVRAHILKGWDVGYPGIGGRCAGRSTRANELVDPTFYRAVRISHWARGALQSMRKSFFKADGNGGALRLLRSSIFNLSTSTFKF